VEVDRLLVALREAGFSPVPDDGGALAVAGSRRAAPRPKEPPTGVGRTGRARVPAAELVEALRNASDRPAPVSRAHRELARFAEHLDAAAVALLADAVDHGRDVRIQYRNRAGNRTLRDIRPQEAGDGYVVAWCHLRGAPREFALHGIEAVGLAD
jgi:predicted DNA-binding transcriptional regulator YafY